VRHRARRARCFGRSRARERAGLTDIEELDDDLATSGLDELATTGKLLVPRGLGVPSVFGADPAVEREPLHHVTRLELRGSSVPGPSQCPPLAAPLRIEGFAATPGRHPGHHGRPDCVRHVNCCLARVVHDRRLAIGSPGITPGVAPDSTPDVESSCPRARARLLSGCRVAVSAWGERGVGVVR